MTDREIEKALAIYVLGHNAAWTWHPMEKVEHAMQVFHGMSNKGWGCDLDKGEYSFPYRVSFMKNGTYFQGVKADLCQVICMTALEAIQSES